ncbi:MAG: sulfur carrier protein ThiS [Thermodesulfobacteriota bacterium]|nr:sulfur carrier protein ThiS [Thermodesulfobacteriota bacterium]
MNIILNGNNKSLQKPSSILDLLKSLELMPETVVVELNTTIIQPNSYDATQFAEGDRVEIIRFVGGG